MSFGHLAKSQRVLAFCVQVWVVGIWPNLFFSRILMPRIVIDTDTGLQVRELKRRRGAKGRAEDLGAICFWPVKTDSIHLYNLFILLWNRCFCSGCQFLCCGFFCGRWYLDFVAGLLSKQQIHISILSLHPGFQQFVSFGSRFCFFCTSHHRFQNPTIPLASFCSRAFPFTSIVKRGWS